MRLALFDVDGTLLPNPSGESRLFWHLVSRGCLGPRQFGSALGFMWRHLRSDRHALKRNKAYLAGVSVAEIDALAARFVAAAFVPRLRQAVVERLEVHRRAGDVLALLTGMPDLLAAPLAAALKVTIVRATRCATSAAVFAARPPLRHPFGADKLRLAAELAAELGLDFAACTAYADSIHDLALLEKVGCTLAVHPDAALERLARARSWEILDADTSWRQIRRLAGRFSGPSL